MFALYFQIEDLDPMGTIMAYLALAPLLLVIAMFVDRNPPEQRNQIYGYRTKRSMKSEESWRMANDYGNRWFLRFTIILNVLQLIFFLLLDLVPAVVITSILMLFGIGLMFYRVETKLKENGF